MQAPAPDHDSAWTSDGLGRSDALEHWRSWFAKRPEAPVEVSVYEAGEFDAYLASRGIGQVRMLHMRAPAQKVVHHRLAEEPAAADHLIHMLYTLEGTIGVNGLNDVLGLKLYI